MKEQTTPLFDILVVQHVGMPKKCKGYSCCNCNVSDGSGSSSEEETDDIDSVKSELSGEINTVNTRLSNHISDTHCHTTNTEKNYWNNKLDATTFDTTIAALRNDIPLNPITSANLADALEALGLLDGNHNPSTGGGSSSGSYLKAGDFLGTINNISFVQGDDITIPVGSDPSTWDEQTWQNIYNHIEQHGGGSYKITGLSFANNVLTISLENNTAKTVTINAGTPGTGSLSYTAATTAGTPNSYLIGTITYNGNSYPIYGKDNVGSGGSDPFELKPATSDRLGGIYIGYERGSDEDSRNYAVQLDDNNRAFVYVPWINTPGGDPNPDNPDEKKDKIITLTESEFNELDRNGELESDTTYIVLDDETGLVKFICYVDKYGIKHITTMPVSNEDELKVQNITIDQWNSMSDSEKDMNTIYVVYSGTGSNKALVGLGISKVLTRVPVPANGTVVRLTQSEYDNLGSALDQGTLYLIVANNVVTKMYLGSIEIPVGSENEEGVVKSIITTMFSEKIQWEGDQVKSLNWGIIDVDAGLIYGTTGFEDLVTNTIREAGFISKTYNTGSFAEMFATLVDDNDKIVKKASILASINASGESNVKISADKIDVSGVFNQYASSSNKKSATQLLSDGEQIVARASAIADGVMRATEVTASPGMYEISAVTVDNNNSLTSNALFRIGTQAVGSEIYLKADKIYLDGNTTVAGKISANAAAIGSLLADYASIESLYATKSYVNSLEANYATITLLNATKAEVVDLIAQQASIATSLRVGTAGSSEVYIDAIEDAESPRIAMYDNNGLERTVFGGEDQERDFDNLKNYIRLNGSGYFAGGNFSWDSDGNVRLKNAYVSGDIDATSFKVKNGEYDSIVFTTYNSSTYSGSEYSGLNSAGLQDGDPIGLVYDSENHTPKYFFDFAPVNNGTFSSEPLLTYKISNNGASSNGGKITISNGPTYYKVTDQNNDNYNKYITLPRANGELINTSEDLYLYVDKISVIKANGASTGYYLSECHIWRKISFSNGELQKQNTGFITDTFVLNATIQSYKASSSSVTIYTSKSNNNLYQGYDSTVALDPSYQMWDGTSYSNIYPIVNNTEGTAVSNVTVGTTLSGIGGKAKLANVNVFVYAN